MASSKRRQDGEATVKAVLVYAAQLRERADAAKIRDPHVELYRPSNDAARKVSQQYGPQRALEVLATRARKAELRYEEAEQESTKGRERLQRLQLIVAGQRAAEAERLTLGERLDAALLRIGLQSDVSAVQLDADPVSGGKPSSVAPKSRRDRQRDDAIFDARRAVERLEREAAQTGRRLVEEEAMAA